MTRAPLLGKIPLRSLVLLAALLAVILLSPLGAGGEGAGILVKLLTTAVICLGGYLLHAEGRWLLAYAVVAVPALLVGLVDSSPLEFPVLLTIHDLLLLLLELMLVGAVVRFALFNRGAGQLDRIVAGICGYLVLGMLWQNLYTICERSVSGSFLFGGEPVSLLDGSLLYYSFVTLSTLGYGEITPAQPWARMLAALEAVVGALYLAVFIASLMSSPAEKES
jgi:hypothetical protein